MHLPHRRTDPFDAQLKLKPAYVPPDEIGTLVLDGGPHKYSSLHPDLYALQHSSELVFLQSPSSTQGFQVKTCVADV